MMFNAEQTRALACGCTDSAHANSAAGIVMQTLPCEQINYSCFAVSARKLCSTIHMHLCMRTAVAAAWGWLSSSIDVTAEWRIAACRTQGNSGSPNMPSSSRRVAPAGRQSPSADQEKATKPSLAAARDGAAAACRSDRSSRAARKEGCFEPPWTSMRRKAGTAAALPSNWGWVAPPSQQVGQLLYCSHNADLSQQSLSAEYLQAVRALSAHFGCC